jgi:uncharacterized protein (DUF1697 family)
MAELRDLCGEIGLAEARTLLQSGNIVFDAGRNSDAEVERLLEGEIKSRLGVSTQVMIRTPAEWTAMIAGNPFGEEAERDPGHLVAVALKGAPSAKAVKALQDAISGREIVRAAGRHLYVVYPDGIGRSRLTNPVIETKLGLSATGRNWNTVLKIASLLQA